MNKHNRIFQIVILGIYLLTFLFIFKNLSYEYLWFDEAGQFWISKGLNHDSAPFSPEGGLGDVIKMNKYYNMDPGGFGILLHYWSAISNHVIWLRLLPFIFFIGVIIVFIYLSFKWLKNMNIALLMGFIPVFLPLVLNMGFEVRAYSMETLGTVLSVVALEQMRDKLSYKNLFLWGCVFSLFMTSRYSLIVVIFVASIYILQLIIIDDSRLKKKLLMIGVYSIPIVISLAYIYFFAYVYQKADHRQLPYLQFLSNNPLVILKPLNLIYVFLVGICAMLYFTRHKYQALDKYAPLLFLTIVVNILFIILSLMGIHPWRISKSCISMIVLILLCFSFLSGKLLRMLEQSHEVVKYGILAFLLIFVFYERVNTLYPRNVPGYNLYVDFKKINLGAYNKIYIESWESPCVRYLFEYGGLKNEKHYPDKFTLGKGILHSNYTVKDSLQAWAERTPKMNDLMDYDLVLASRLYDWSSKNNDQWQRMENSMYFWVRREDMAHEPVN